MATPALPQVNIGLLRFQADNIPFFDGNPKQLHRFINACENFIRAFQNANNPDDPINICLFDTVLSKLRDRAADLIGSRTELNSWNLIKDALNLTFSDQRSIDCLIQDLIAIKPNKIETPLQFGMRIQDSRSLLFSKLNCTLQDPTEKLIKIQHYDDFALKTFINGLPYNMQLVVRLRKPENLEEALAFVKEEENFIYFKTGHNSNLQNSIYTPQPRINNVTNNLQRLNIPNIRPPTSYPNPFSQTNYNPQNFGKQNNPNGRIFSPPQNMSIRPTFRPTPNFQHPFSPFRNNIPNNTTPPNFTRPNWQPYNRLPAQRHPMFNNQNSNLPPRSQITKNYPEPMDTSSSNSRMKPAPKIKSQELYNMQQIENDPYADLNNYEEDPSYNNCNTQYNFQYYDTDPYNNDIVAGYPVNLQQPDYDPNMTDYTVNPAQSICQNENVYPEEVNFPQVPDPQTTT